MSLSVYGLDPGPERTALVALDGNHIYLRMDSPNDIIVQQLKQLGFPGMDDPLIVGIEKIASYGMAVGAHVFETCRWCGEFRRILKDRDIQFREIPRIAVKSHICHSAKAKDANIRQALIDMFGAPGTKKNPGGTYGMSGDMWAALAVAVTLRDTLEEKKEAA